jgi:hypothetical protein
MPKAGPGRPKGSVNKATKDIREKAAKTGVMPVDILLDIARFHYQKALKLRHSRPRKTEDRERVALELKAEHALAADAANKAAPFYHPKLATLQSNVNLTGRLTLEDLVRQSIPAPANSNAPLIDADVEETDAAAE